MTNTAFSPKVIQIVKEGPQGPAIGDMRGEWVAGSYKKRSITTHIGALWLALRNTSGVPGTSADWLQLVAPGDPVPQTIAARDAAIAAQAAAETAETNAETAEDGAEVARDEAVEARNDAIQAIVNPAVYYDTLPELNADLAHAAGVMGVVDTGADAGTYRKSGGIGAGSWVKKSDATIASLDIDKVSKADLSSTSDPEKGAGAVGFIAGVTGAVGRPALLKMRDIISMFDVLEPSLAEAIGQKEDTSSDSAVFASAFATLINDLKVRGGKIVFPRGLYMVRQTRMYSNIHLEGEGRENTILRMAADQDGNILLNPFSDAQEISNISIEGITFDGNGVGVLAARSTVDLSFLDGLSVKSCAFTGGTGYGLALQARGSVPAGRQKKIYIEDTWFYGNGAGIPGGEFHDGLDVKDADTLVLIGCEAWDNADKGMDIRGRDVTLIGNVTHDNGAYGLGLGVNGEYRAGDIVVVGHHSHHNGNDGVVVYDGSTGTERLNLDIIGLQTHENAGHGLHLNQAENWRVSLTGGRSWSNTAAGVRVVGFEQLNIANFSISSNQGYGIQTDGGTIKMVGGTIENNTLGPVNVSSRLVAENVQGYKSSANVLMEDAFAVDSTGVKLIDIPHGLPFTPDRGNCTLTLARNTTSPVQDFEVAWMWVVLTDATKVQVQVRVITASAVSGSKCAINLAVRRA